MDNFMDKLAEKYNAQDMIRANSQAESAQMQNLQEQVEAYEAVLQEMRKLNYKNTELTQKMYALVDESIEKVRTLQIEAEGGANTEVVSREMTDAVNRAMSEAVSNLDETVVRSLTQTLENALQQPADQLRQSTEDVKNSVVAVQSSADDMRSGVDSIKTGIDSLKNDVEDITVELGDMRSDMQDRLFNLTQTANSSEATINYLAGLVNDFCKKDSDSGLSQEMADELQRISDRLKEMQDSTLSGISEQLEKMQKETLDGISGQMEGIRSMPVEEDNSGRETLEKVNTSIEALEKISASVEELKQQAKINGIIQETLSAMAENNAKTQDSITELKSTVSALKEDDSTDKDAELKEAISRIASESRGSQEAIIKAVTGAGEDTKNSISELKTATGENRSALEDIFTVLQSTKSEVEEIKAGAATKSNTHEEDLVKALNDLLSNHAEVSSNIKNLKAATDENKNTIKSTIDSSIYGLKQDNKEIVEFLQRMNANILKKGEDEEKAAQKEEEAAAKAEEERRQLEERFKATEDFMHKESVKVYRNVQAVINEKNDKQKESVESANLSVEKRVSKVKALVVINMVFTLINLATMILYIFGFLGAH